MSEEDDGDGDVLTVVDPEGVNDGVED